MSRLRDGETRDFPSRRDSAGYTLAGETKVEPCRLFEQDRLLCLAISLCSSAVGDRRS